MARGAHEAVAEASWAATVPPMLQRDATSEARVLKTAVEAALAYAADVDRRPAAPSPDALEALAAFDEPLPASGADPVDTLELLDRLSSPATMANTGSRYFGFVNGATYPVALGSRPAATRIATRLREGGATVLNDVMLNQVLVRFGDGATTEAVTAAVQADGWIWCGPTMWDGETAMRVIVSSWKTTLAGAERAAALILEAAACVRG